MLMLNIFKLLMIKLNDLSSTGVCPGIVELFHKHLKDCLHNLMLREWASSAEEDHVFESKVSDFRPQLQLVVSGLSQLLFSKIVIIFRIITVCWITEKTKSDKCKTVSLGQTQS